MMTPAERARTQMIHDALDRDRAPLSRRDVFLIGSINNVSDALHRLRRAAFGMDREDRIPVALRTEAEHSAGRQKPPKRATRRRRTSRSPSSRARE